LKKYFHLTPPFFLIFISLSKPTLKKINFEREARNFSYPYINSSFELKNSRADESVQLSFELSILDGHSVDQ